GLSAILYMVYGIGACIGPLVAGVLMRELESGVYFVFVSACAVVLVALVRPQRVTGDNLSQDAPTQFVPMSDTLHTSDVVATLDPRVDVESDISFVPVEPEDIAPHATAQAAASPESVDADNAAVQPSAGN